MNKREMANELMLRANRLRAQSGSPEFVAEAKLNVAASEALHREADAEEKAKPKVTLLEQRRVAAQAAADYSSGGEPETRDGFYAIADTLYRLDEEGKRFLIKARGQSELLSSGDIWPAVRVMCSFLRSVVTEPCS